MRRRFPGLVLLVMLALARAATARSPTPFTAQDMSRVASITVLDVSEDGRRIAATVRRPSDNETTTSYQPSRDGSFVTVMEDVTEKTDYDTIGGTDNVLKYVDAKSGDAKTLVPARDLKGLQLRWSDDGRWFAYAKEGEVFIQGVDGSQPRNLTPKPKSDEEKDKAPAERSDADKDKKDTSTQQH